MNAEWIKLLTALVSAGGLGTIIFKTVVPWVRRRNIRRIWGSLVDTSNALRVAISRCGCCRVLLIESTNGGGVPGPSNPAKVTVLYDATDGKTRSIAGMWNHVTPDHQYSELLGKLSIAEGFVHLVTAELEAGDLRNLYEADEVLQSFVFRLAATEKEMIYVSYNFSHAGELTPHQLEGIRETKMRLRQLVREHDDTYRHAPL